jgi:TusA-related sulfurtransferase
MDPVHTPAQDAAPDDALPVVDAIGLPCPQPVIELARAVEALTVGRRVVLLATDPAAKVDVPVWCRLKRQTLRESSVDDAGVWRFVVERAN